MNLIQKLRAINKIIEPLEKERDALEKRLIFTCPTTKQQICQIDEDSIFFTDKFPKLTDSECIALGKWLIDCYSQTEDDLDEKSFESRGFIQFPTSMKL